MSLIIRSARRSFPFSAPGALFVPVPPMLALPFLAGVIAGSLIGMFSTMPNEFLSSIGLPACSENCASFLHAIWHSFRFVFLSALLGSGILGVLLIPLLSALRGFSFACAVAAVFRPLSFSSFSLALISFGIPSLLALPGFLIAETDAFGFSVQLLTRDHSAPMDFRSFLRHFAVVLFLCAAEALYNYALLPSLLRLLT